MPLRRFPLLRFAPRRQGFSRLVGCAIFSFVDRRAAPVCPSLPFVQVFRCVCAGQTCAVSGNFARVLVVLPAEDPKTADSGVRGRFLVCWPVHKRKIAQEAMPKPTLRCTSEKIAQRACLRSLRKTSMGVCHGRGHVMNLSERLICEAMACCIWRELRAPRRMPCAFAFSRSARTVEQKARPFEDDRPVSGARSACPSPVVVRLTACAPPDSPGRGRGRRCRRRGSRRRRAGPPR